MRSTKPERRPAATCRSYRCVEGTHKRCVRTKVQAQFFTDPGVKGRNIDVTTANGVVTLSGKVDSEAARRRAIEIARGTEGVRDVEDHLRVETAAEFQAVSEAARSGRRLSDDDIADRIEAKYYRDEDTSTIGTRTLEPTTST